MIAAGGEFDESDTGAQQRLRELEAVASLGSWEWDVVGDRVRWSAQLFDIFGLKREEFEATFEGYLSRVHPDDRGFARSTVEHALATTTPWAADYRIVLPSGETRWIHSRGRVTSEADSTAVRLVGTCQDITEQREVLHWLMTQAIADPLTGLLTRWVIVDRLRHVLDRQARYGRLPAVLFIDLDRLKVVNDNLGHAAGDQVLRRAAGTLQAATRSSDTVGRYGGDEFIVICEDLEDEGEAQLIAHRILTQLRIPALDDDDGLVVTASVGVTVAAAGEPAEIIISRADAAMYQAKHRGGAAVAVLPAEPPPT